MNQRPDTPATEPSHEAPSDSRGEPGGFQPPKPGLPPGPAGPQPIEQQRGGV